MNFNGFAAGGATVTVNSISQTSKMAKVTSSGDKHDAPPRANVFKAMAWIAPVTIS